jgi:multidrug efflux system membrane fusion protein
LVAQLDAAVKVDDAQINSAQVQLGFTKIVAPISGRVGARLVDPGNIVHASDTNGLVVINQIDPIAVVFTLPGDAVQVIHRAQQANPQPLKVQVFTRDDKTLLATGQLVLVNNQIDTSSGTVQLKGRFANPTHRLWPGQYLNVHLVLGDRARALTVPAAVVQRNQEGTYAYVVNADDTVRLQPIKVALIQDGTAIIDAGLTAGERVVLDGQYKITTGTKVAAAPASAAAGAASAAGGAR